MSSSRSAEFPLPLVNAKHGDNGIMFYGREEIFASAKMTIDIVQNGAVATGDVYPQPEKTGVLWDAYLIKAKHHADTVQTLCYVAGAIEKVIKPKFGYDNKAYWKDVSKEEIVLPVISRDDNVLDIAYMDAFIRALEEARIQELEDARIRELEKWLVASGLNDYSLTIQERKALDDWLDGKIRQKTVTIDKLFSVDKPKRRFNANAVKFGGTHPYVVRTSQNNGRRMSIVADEKWLNPGSTISFGQDTATIFFQDEPYFTGDKIKVMSFLHGELDERVACWLLTAMRKSFANFTWGTSSFNENNLKKVEVSVPLTEAKALDLDFMSLFIRATIKQVIRGVVEWKDREIATMRRVVSGKPYMEGKSEGSRSQQIPPVLRIVAESLKYREYLPVYSFKAACGPLAEGEEAEIDGWIKVEGHGILDDTQFVIRTEGVSMAGLIPENSLCIMRKIGGGSLDGKTVLIQRNDADDPESGGAFTIKKFMRTESGILLKAKDPKYDIPLEDDAEYSQKYRAIAEFKCVL